MLQDFESPLQSDRKHQVLQISSCPAPFETHQMKPEPSGIRSDFSPVLRWRRITQTADDNDLRCCAYASLPCAADVDSGFAK